MKSAAKMDMTQGPIMRKVLAFALPICAGNVLQQLYSTVDTVVIGNFCGSTSLAAVGTSSQPVELLLCIFLGIGTGVSILVSQFVGNGNEKKLREIMETSVFFLYMCAIPLSVAGQFIGPLVLKIMQVPEDTWAPAVSYIAIIFWGTLGNMGYNMNAGILRGLGDSRASLLFLVISCVVNVVLDLVFVAGFHMDVAGAALATVMGTCLTVLILCTHFFSKENHLKLAGGFSLKRAFAVASNGLASFILEMSGGFVTFIFNRQLLAYVGETGVVVYSIISNAALVVKSISNGIAQAAQPLISTNYGAGEHGRVGEARSLGIRISLFAGVLFQRHGVRQARYVCAGEFHERPGFQRRSTKAPVPDADTMRRKRRGEPQISRILQQEHRRSGTENHRPHRSYREQRKPGRPRTDAG